MRVRLIELNNLHNIVHRTPNQKFWLRPWYLLVFIVEQHLVGISEYLGCFRNFTGSMSLVDVSAGLFDVCDMRLWRCGGGWDGRCWCCWTQCTRAASCVTTVFDEKPFNSIIRISHHHDSCFFQPPLLHDSSPISLPQWSYSDYLKKTGPKNAGENF